MVFVFLIMTFDPVKCFLQHYGSSDRRGSILLCSSVSGKALLRKKLLPRPYRLEKTRKQSPCFCKSRKGICHMAMPFASGVGMTYAWLAEQGVLSLKCLWAEQTHLR